jgi:predicted molibdopterin-dependent oxidoreductase YjgC
MMRISSPAHRRLRRILESLESFTPEWAESVSGVPAESIREAARLYAKQSGPPSIGAWASARAPTAPTTPSRWSNLALMCGHVGKAGTGLNPLRGQNNVQGCSDSGGLPNVFTAYQNVADDGR